MGRRRSAKAYRANSSWEHIETIKPEEYFQRLPKLDDFFQLRLANRGTLEIEIGCGAGTFLLATAEKFPETTFVGIDYSGKFVRALRDQVLEKKLGNVVLLCTEAHLFLQKMLPNDCVQAYHIYFPDPWPKRAQNRKRLLKNQGGLEILRTLKPKGHLYFATDSRDYAEFVDRELALLTDLEVLEARIVSKATPRNYVAYGGSTHYGEKYLKMDKPIFVRVLQKQMPK